MSRTHDTFVVYMGLVILPRRLQTFWSVVCEVEEIHELQAGKGSQHDVAPTRLWRTVSLLGKLSRKLHSKRSIQVDRALKWLVFSILLEVWRGSLFSGEFQELIDQSKTPCDNSKTGSCLAQMTTWTATGSENTMNFMGCIRLHDRGLERDLQKIWLIDSYFKCPTKPNRWWKVLEQLLDGTPSKRERWTICGISPREWVTIFSPINLELFTDVLMWLVSRVFPRSPTSMGIFIVNNIMIITRCC